MTGVSHGAERLQRLRCPVRPARGPEPGRRVEGQIMGSEPAAAAACTRRAGPQRPWRAQWPLRVTGPAARSPGAGPRRQSRPPPAVTPGPSPTLDKLQLHRPGTSMDQLNVRPGTGPSPARDSEPESDTVSGARPDAGDQTPAASELEERTRSLPESWPGTQAGSANGNVGRTRPKNPSEAPMLEHRIH